MKRVRYGTGRASITLDDRTSEAIRAMLEASHGAVLAALERETEQVCEDARAAWPRKSGVSAAGLEWGIRVTSTSVESYVANPVDYAYYVKAKGSGRQSWNELVVKPMKAAGRRLIKELGSEVAAAANKVV